LASRCATARNGPVDGRPAEARKRGVLLCELQHWVKNNFRLILASIAIQKNRYSGAEVHRVLNHVASRINAISLAIARDQLATLEEGQLDFLNTSMPYASGYAKRALSK
jgi:two-component sensor histidine kinase